MSTVAIWVGVYKNKPVVEARCDFIRFIGRMLDSVCGIIDKVFQGNLDHVGFNA